MIVAPIPQEKSKALTATEVKTCDTIQARKILQNPTAVKWQRFIKCTPQRAVNDTNFWFNLCHQDVAPFQIIVNEPGFMERSGVVRELNDDRVTPRSVLEFLRRSLRKGPKIDAPNHLRSDNRASAIIRFGICHNPRRWNVQLFKVALVLPFCSHSGTAVESTKISSCHVVNLDVIIFPLECYSNKIRHAAGIDGFAVKTGNLIKRTEQAGLTLGNIWHQPTTSPLHHCIKHQSATAAAVRPHAPPAIGLSSKRLATSTDPAAELPLETTPNIVG